MNAVQIDGIVRARSELSRTHTGDPALNFALEQQRHTGQPSRFPVVVYGQLAAVFDRDIENGMHVLVGGSLQEQRWHQKETRKLMSKSVVRANFIAVGIAAEQALAQMADTDEVVDEDGDGDDAGAETAA